MDLRSAVSSAHACVEQQLSLICIFFSLVIHIRLSVLLPTSTSLQTKEEFLGPHFSEVFASKWELEMTDRLYFSKNTLASCRSTE